MVGVVEEVEDFNPGKVSSIHGQQHYLKIDARLGDMLKLKGCVDYGEMSKERRLIVYMWSSGLIRAVRTGLE